MTKSKKTRTSIEIIEIFEASKQIKHGLFYKGNIGEIIRLRKDVNIYNRPQQKSIL